MEPLPPAKRLRIGPSPFNARRADVEVDDDDDELSSRPEEINARRDPGYQLQKSRAVAAFKLKSAFERIFEKYEKDFTGIGDEVDLRTGEIVVDNGHIQSLKSAEIGGREGKGEGEGADEDGDSDMDAEEEERILQGKPDNRLSLRARNPMPLTMQPRPPVFPEFQGAWPGAAEFMGAPPHFSNMMHPTTRQFGGLPMPMSYSIPAFPQSADPAWRAPDFPVAMSPMFGSDQRPRVKARVPLLTNGDAGDDDDDLLLGVSAAAVGEPATEGTAATSPASVLPSATPQRNSDASKGSDSGAVPASRLDPTPTRQQAPYKIPESTKSSVKKRKPKDGGSSALKPTRTGAKPPKNKEANDSAEACEGSTNKSKRRPGKKDTQTTRPPPTSPSQRQDSDLFVSHCLPDGGLAVKPTNQKLQVEITRANPVDFSSYIFIAAEANPDLDAAEPPQPNHSHDASPETPGHDVLVLHAAQGGPPEPDDGTMNCHNDTELPAEVFMRNTQDPSYLFSDEDEPTIPRKKPVARRRTSAGDGVATTPGEATSPVPSNNGARSPLAAEPSRTNGETIVAPFEERAAITRANDPPVPTKKPNPAPETPQPTTASQQHALGSAEGASAGTFSLLKMKPRRAKRSLGNTGHTLTPDASSDSLGEPAQEVNSNFLAGSAPRRERKRRRARSSVTGEEYVAPTSPVEQPTCAPDRVSRERIIPETPETSPDPEPRKEFETLPRQPSPDLGTDLASVSFAVSEEEAALETQPAQEDSGDTVHSPIANPPEAETSTTADTTQTPKTPTHRGLRHLSRPNQGSSTKTGILSLVSDDEDELSLGPDDFTPSGSRRRKEPSAIHISHRQGSVLGPRGSSPSTAPPSSSRTISRRRSTLTKRGAIVGNSSHKKDGHRVQTHTPPPKGRFGSFILSRLSASSSRSLSGTTFPSRGGSGRGTGTGTATASSGVGGTAQHDHDGDIIPGSPASRIGSELVQTPGGSMRRCGEGDFRCDRDFCFVCL